jgi:hypothetical protein
MATGLFLFLRVCRRCATFDVLLLRNDRRQGGVPTTICPAPNHAIDLDLAQLRQPSFKVEPPAFHLHGRFPGEQFGSVVTHQVPIDNFDGPHPFFMSGGKQLQAGGSGRFAFPTNSTPSQADDLGLA